MKRKEKVCHEEIEDGYHDFFCPVAEDKDRTVSVKRVTCGQRTNGPLWRAGIVPNTTTIKKDFQRTLENGRPFLMNLFKTVILSPAIDTNCTIYHID